MKSRYENDNELNFIRRIILQELEDRDTSLKAMEDAERQWELEQQKHPEEAEAVMRKAAVDFEKLMVRIRKSGEDVGTGDRNGEEECLEEVYKDTGNAAEILEGICETEGEAAEKPEKEHKIIAEQTTDSAGDEGHIRAEAEGDGCTGSKADGKGYAGSMADGNDDAMILGRKNAANTAGGEGCIKAVVAGESSMADQTYPEQHRTIGKPEREYRKPIAFCRKTSRKLAIVAAAAMILGVGGMVSSARQGYRMAEYPEQYGKDQRTIVRNNVAVSFPESRLEEAYKQIGDVCGIEVLALDYIPEGMELDDFVLSDSQGVITLSYKNKKIHLEQKPLQERSTVSVLTMDRKQENIIQNVWLDQELYLEENLLKSGSVEYSIEFDTDSANYYLSGMLEKDEFIKIVQNLYFWN